MSDYKAALGDFNRAAGHYELPRIPGQVLTSHGQCYAALGEPDRDR